MLSVKFIFCSFVQQKKVVVNCHYFSTMRFLKQIADLDNDYADWPKSQTVFGLHYCPTGKNMIIERKGEFNKLIDKPGMFFALPFLDHIKYIVDMREQTVSINGQTILTKDNVQVSISCVVYIQFFDASKAAYSCVNPLTAIRQHAQFVLRAIVGEHELSQLLAAETQLNTAIKDTIQETSQHWGLSVNSCKILDLSPDKEVLGIVHKQRAEQLRLESLISTAESNKKLAELNSSIDVIKLKNEIENNKKRIEFQGEISLYARRLKVMK